MISLALFSEPFAATGSMSAAGARESLGRPHMDMLSVLVREAVQNSWDARRHDGNVVPFFLRGVTATGSLAARWRDAFGQLPDDHLGLGEVLSRGSFELLFVADRNTTGLTGSTRADRINDTSEMDFVDFVRNVGQPRDAEFGGGTYGYGKSIFYIASRASTILVYSRTMYEGRCESRLIGGALGGYFRLDGKPYTGRHWWGEVRDEIIEPLLDDEADELAAELGFEVYEGDRTGTTTAVVGFEGLDAAGVQRPPRQAMEVMAEAIAWHCWPKYGLANRSDEMVFEVSWNNEHIELVDERLPVLASYRRALDRVLACESLGESDSVHRLSSQRPQQHLGLFGIQRAQRLESDYTPHVAPIDSPSHHVALIREPALIVKYLPGPAIQSDEVEWAGVFKAAREVDDAFAKAEPPTHDDWISSFLPRPEKVFVNVALRKIVEIANEEMAPQEFKSEPGETEPLGELSSRLGSLIAFSTGTGPKPPTTTGGGGARRRGYARANGEPRLTHRDGRRAMLVPFHAEPLAEKATLSIMPLVLVDGGRTEHEPPEGIEAPELLEVEVGGTSSRSGELIISGYTEGTVLVSVPDDTMVRIGFDLEEHDAGG
jgi:hypothetical protein